MSDHTWKECKCNEPGCWVCDGGLAICTVCNAIEGGLPSECPGESMSGQQVDDVYYGRTDFRNGQWVSEVSKFSPLYLCSLWNQKDKEEHYQ